MVGVCISREVHVQYGIGGTKIGGGKLVTREESQNPKKVIPIRI